MVFRRVQNKQDSSPHQALTRHRDGERDKSLICFWHIVAVARAWNMNEGKHPWRWMIAKMTRRTDAPGLPASKRSADTEVWRSHPILLVASWGKRGCKSSWCEERRQPDRYSECSMIWPRCVATAHGDAKETLWSIGSLQVPKFLSLFLCINGFLLYFSSKFSSCCLIYGRN